MYERLPNFGCIVLALLLAPCLGLRVSGQETQSAQIESPATIPQVAEIATTPEITAEDYEPPVWTPIGITARAGYWLAFQKRAPLGTPLVSKGLNTDAKPGVLGQGGSVVYGADSVSFHERSGGYFNLGIDLSGVDDLWLEAGYRFVGDRRVGFAADSPGSTPAYPVLARPFFNVLTQAEDASVVAYPGLLAGSIDIKNTSFFQSTEIATALKVLTYERQKVYVLTGFCYRQLDETIRIHERNLVVDPKNALVGRTINIEDLFGDDNHFYGGQIGIRWLWQWSRLSLEVTGKVALGATHTSASVGGFTSIDTNPATTVPGGLLALQSNIGRYSTTSFAVSPEVDVNVGLDIFRWLRLQAGYNFIYWNQVVRPGDMIDRRLDPRNIPTSSAFGQAGAQPFPSFQAPRTDFWIQGLQVGLLLTF